MGTVSTNRGSRAVMLILLLGLTMVAQHVESLPRSTGHDFLVEEQLLLVQAPTRSERLVREATEERSALEDLEGQQEDGRGDVQHDDVQEDEVDGGDPDSDDHEEAGLNQNEGGNQGGSGLSNEEEPEASGDNDQQLEDLSQGKIMYITEEAVTAPEDDEDNDDHDDDDDDDDDDENELAACANYPYGCCPNSQLPAHGPEQEGCCLASELGCCADNIRTALGPEGQSCGSCEESAHGCCPDGTTPARGPGGEGCGCLASEFGCCQDQHTRAQGPNYEGCPCETFDNGCCSDGVSVAREPNKEDCPGCSESEYGCCPDNFTPASGPEMQGCGCEASEHGCCPDGITAATGPEFQGCEAQPGAACYLSQKKGSCENFAVRWYFDTKEGRCSRFWYGGCEGNANRFIGSEDCEQMCVNPPGSARCYLPKVSGMCTGNYERYYYDPAYKQCVPFVYGGCLGNANRFKTKLDCEQSCVRSESQAVCEQPMEPGPCLGNHTRWAYNEETGQCVDFAYGGCQGNRNRFTSHAACEAACRHKRITLEAATRCKQPPRRALFQFDAATVEAACAENATSGKEVPTAGAVAARWAFYEKTRRCRPFYHADCGDSGSAYSEGNNFLTAAECEAACPAAFPPELEVTAKVLNIEEGKETVLEVRVEGHPFPRISWQHNNNDVELPSDRMELRADRSLVITRTELSDAGSWMVVADNGLGKVARKQIALSVYPSYIPVQVKIDVENTTYETGSTIRLGCGIVAGYPPPRLTWYKNNARIPKSTRIVVEEENTLIINRASPVDGGVYICRATNEKTVAQAVVDISVIQATNKGQQPLCVDRPRLANCALIVRARYCTRNANLARLCCQSCMEAGQISTPPA